MRHSSTLPPSSTVTVMNLVAPSPSRTIICASSCDRAITAADKAAYPALSIASTSTPEAPVAISMNESLVDVSPSMVMQLNDWSAASLTRWSSTGLRHLGVGGDKSEHGRHVGPDHAGAFGDPGQGHALAADLRRCVDAALGWVSVVMIASAASYQLSGFRLAMRLRQSGADAVHRQRLQDHPGRKRQHLRPRRSPANRPGRRRSHWHGPGRPRRCRHWHCRY